MAMPQAPYPVQFSVDYPDRPLNRLTTAFRIFVAIPILIVLGSVSGGLWARTYSNGRSFTVSAGAGGILFFAPLLMILFRRKYPRWWFDWNLELQRFTNRVFISSRSWTTDTRPPINSRPSTWTTSTRMRLAI
jgi:hypothetical protein